MGAATLYPYDAMIIWNGLIIGMRSVCRPNNKKAHVSMTSQSSNVYILKSYRERLETNGMFLFI